ncbi:nicotinate phosphoribosyltransferase [Acrasis kona]|uniref:Nicotinate phosphoribosyltransferase n=1 Tax=Acrasis kona TaxID=1008807 RepID=A0AAW2ZJR3_9EUKA
MDIGQQDWLNEASGFIQKSFYTYDAENAIRAFLMWTVFLMLILQPLRFVTLKFVRTFLPPNRQKLPDELVPRSRGRTLFAIFYGVWTMVMIVGYPNLYRLSGPLFLCYWAFTFSTIFCIFTAFPRYRSFKRFAMSFLVWPVHSTSIMANFGYVYYGIMTFRWEYEVVHFAPPLLLWMFMLTNMHEYDDSVNYLTNGFWSTAWALLSGLFFTAAYQQFSMPVVVYRNEMRNMFLLATVGISSVEYITLIIWSATRAIWLKFFASKEVKMFYGTEDSHTKNM